MSFLIVSQNVKFIKFKKCNLQIPFSLVTHQCPKLGVHIGQTFVYQKDLLFSIGSERVLYTDFYQLRRSKFIKMTGYFEITSSNLKMFLASFLRAINSKSWQEMAASCVRNNANVWDWQVLAYATKQYLHTV